ncbi:MAG: YbaB/EbfC family nucleoid-associated protein [Acidaminococcus sp.]|jgi:DNA-binding YbaB/EbfC family protein|nr:YbaB/EbfC family nucleoid-associated protein [Acidaminococcus sp.]MCI2100862.1 YbaB/EbfC family nucleoid-associated protein [Acidaminococcus sp.]MCI2115225.1 YbaB/EbfC family nucleoid-associated protein [Acidaminococcus sp.]MCI2116642.1 YbaB/EbfC family nucleoid-associated protein [Acidaminococcus sp.]
MYRGGMGMNNMQGMLKKVQKMQNQMLKLQEELKERTVEATAGGEAVKVVVNGSKNIVSLTIAPDAVDPDDVEMLQDMLVTAINDAMKKVDEMTESEMSKVTGGMKLPGMF